jgi:Zn-dependent protease with chaperone function
VAIVLALEGEALLPTIAWFAFFFLMVYYRRRGEYQADLAAARFVQPTSMISALLRFQSPTRKYERFLGGLTHPPTGARIERLRRLGPSC